MRPGLCAPVTWSPRAAPCCSPRVASRRRSRPRTSTATPQAATGQAAAPTEESTEVVATYAGKKLTGAEVLSEIDRLPGPSRAYLSAPDRKRQFVENLILNDLLFAEAQKAGYDKDPDIQKQVDDMRKRLVVQRLMREYQKPPTISDDEAKKYYDDNPDLYSSTQIHASHILVKDEATAKKLARRAGGRSEQVRRHREGGSRSTSRAARRVATSARSVRDAWFPSSKRVAFALKPGQMSDIVKTQYGYHIILVTERQEGERKPFDQVKEQIKTMLRNRQLQDGMQTKFDALKKAANVKIDEARAGEDHAATGADRRRPAMPLPSGGALGSGSAARPRDRPRRASHRVRRSRRPPPRPRAARRPPRLPSASGSAASRPPDVCGS